MFDNCNETLFVWGGHDNCSVLVVRFPFDWKTPIGYTAATALQFIILLYELFYVGTFLAFGFGSFLFTCQSVKHPIGILQLVNDYTKINEKHSHISVEFTKFIQSHSINKRQVANECSFRESYWISISAFCFLFSIHNFRLATDLSGLLQATILSSMLCNVLLICASMLLLQTELVSWF